MAKKSSGQRSPYIHPNAFQQARDAFAGEDVAELLGRFEAAVGASGCPHLMLCACLHNFVSIGPDGRQIQLLEYLDAIDPRHVAAERPPTAPPAGRATILRSPMAARRRSPSRATRSSSTPRPTASRPPRP